MKKDTYDVQIVISEKERENISASLQKLLASSYIFYLKVQNYHWNVTGMCFYGLHLFFEKQYEDLAEAVDEIAERIRALGFFPNASFAAFSNLSFIQEETDILPPGAILKQLLKDHEALIAFLREMLPICEKAQDGVTEDLINKRLQVHEKTSWMLRSSLV